MALDYSPKIERSNDFMTVKLHSGINALRFPILEIGGKIVIF